ncbi:MAG: metal-dependent hydrolase, partial [Chitinophagaceae bacterium]|nr:metal-dependent hydrolase [Rubrivivax sp.]
MTPDLPFLNHYPAHLLVPVRQALAEGTLAAHLARRYPLAHGVRSDGALYEHAMALKQRHMRNAPPLAKVVFDNRLQVDQRALGTLTSVSRVQGGQLKAKREIRVSSVFKDAPAAMLD